MTVSVYDHLQPTDADVTGGVYRVVGTDTNEVVLLRVGDADGRRVNTGEVVTVGRAALEGFETAENPDGNRSLGRGVVSGLESVTWSMRVFVEQLLANPIPAAVALTVLAVGRFGGGPLGIPETGQTVLVFVGAIGLALVGSGRFS